MPLQVRQVSERSRFRSPPTFQELGLATRVRNAVLTNTGAYPIVGSGAYLRNTAADAIDDLARRLA